MSLSLSPLILILLLIAPKLQNQIFCFVMALKQYPHLICVQQKLAVYSSTSMCYKNYKLCFLLVPRTNPIPFSVKPWWSPPAQVLVNQYLHFSYQTYRSRKWSTFWVADVRPMYKLNFYFFAYSWWQLCLAFEWV